MLCTKHAHQYTIFQTFNPNEAGPFEGSFSWGRGGGGRGSNTNVKY